jgi:signal transduction histidine kinase
MSAAVPDLVPPSSARRAALVAIGYLLSFALIDWVTYIRPFHALNVTPWNPQVALAIAVLLWNRRWLWLVWLSLVAADVVVRGWPESWPLVLSADAALALAYALIAGLTGQRLQRPPVLSTRRDAAWLALVSVGGGLLTAVVYVATFGLARLGPGTPLLEALVRYWIGDAVGLVVLLPMVLMLMDRRRRDQLVQVLSEPHVWFIALCTAALVAAVFGWGDPDPFRYCYLLFVPVVWAAARLGLPGAVLIAAWTQAGVIVVAQAVLRTDVTVFEVQVLLVAIAMTGLIVGVAVDARERAMEELKGTLRLAAAGEIAAALAHEMTQPLIALSGYTMALKATMAAPVEDLERGPRLARVASRMAEEALRAGEVVQRLREFFRSGESRLGPVAPAALVAHALDAYARRAEIFGVTLRGAADPGLPELRVDPIEIAVVLRNLIRNALDATAGVAGEREVDVRVSRAAHEIRFDVRDNGPGPDAAARARLFEPGPPDRPGGTGVGLSVCRAIVEAHGGRLWLEDSARGHLAFTLPIGGASADA